MLHSYSDAIIIKLEHLTVVKFINLINSIPLGIANVNNYNVHEGNGHRNLKKKSVQ